MSNENEDWEKFKRNRIQLVGIVRQAKRDYYAEIIDESMHDAKKMWKAIKNLIKNEHNEETSELLFQNRSIKNDLISQAKGFSPVCVLKCIFKVVLCAHL